MAKWCDAVVHHGRVLRAEGSPVANALVAVARGTGPTPEIAIRTGADGGFRIALPAGRYRIEAHSGDGAAGGQDLSVGGDAVTFEIVIEPHT